MTKKTIALTLTLVLCLGLLAACGDDGLVGENKAISIALKDAGLKQNKVDVHAHGGSYRGTPCYEIHIEDGGDEYTYYIDAVTGEILNKTNEIHE